MDKQVDSGGEFEKYLKLWKKKSFSSIPDRMIMSATAFNSEIVVTPTHHAYPYFKDGGTEPSGFKVRPLADKDGMHSCGDMRDTGLYCQHLYGGHKGHRIVITEGELDRAAAYQMFEGKVPVVSLRNGAGNAGKDLKESFKFLDQFEEIVICFDADKAGAAAVEQACDVFTGKLRVMRLNPHDGKDACDYLRTKKTAQFTKLYWDAPLHVPSGILDVEEMRALLTQEDDDVLFEYPWPVINEITEGARATELHMLTAGSGLGKSCILREIVAHIRSTTDHRVGCLFMEESAKRTIEGFMSIDLNTPLNSKKRKVEKGSTTYWESFERVYGDEKLFIMDAGFDTGATVDQVVSRVRFMAKALDCKVVVLDHISILVSGGQQGDERKALDEIMTKLRSLTQDTGIVLLAVSHLKRPDGKGHEEGAATSISQLRGSAAIGQLSDFVIGAERNGQAEEEMERNTTRLRVLKNRPFGNTGPADALLYNHDTGRLRAIADEEVRNEMEDAL